MKNKMSDEDKIKELLIRFPPTLYYKDYSSFHRSLRLCPIYVGSPNYALYVSIDGTTSVRVYTDQIGKYFFPTQQLVLEALKNEMQQRIDTLDRYLKEQND